jgi:hypothetical protein
MKNKLYRVVVAACLLSSQAFAQKATVEQFPAQIVRYIPGVNVGITQPYGANNDCSGLASVSPSIILGAPYAKTCTWLDLPQNAAVVVRLPRPEPLTSIVVYVCANGASEYGNVYARSGISGTWTYVGQMQESISVDWQGPIGYEVSLSGTGLTSVRDIKIVGQDNNGRFPGLDLIGVSGLIGQ